jgi:Ca2+-binding EF-hand superfamily protein
MMENNMKLYRTPAEYQAIVSNMSIQEVDSLFETFQNSTSRTIEETQIMNILEAEIERRIARWEVAYV